MVACTRELYHVTLYVRSQRTGRQRGHRTVDRTINTRFGGILMIAMAIEAG